MEWNIFILCFVVKMFCKERFCGTEVKKYENQLKTKLLFVCRQSKDQKAFNQYEKEM